MCPHERLIFSTSWWSQFKWIWGNNWGDVVEPSCHPSVGTVVAYPAGKMVAWSWLFDDGGRQWRLFFFKELSKSPFCHVKWGK